jgi:hypothetical protein
LPARFLAFWPFVRRRARFGVPSVEKSLGSLPVVAGFCSRLRIRDLVDGLCPVNDRSDLTHGQVIEVLVANRLTSPKPLVHVEGWARDWAVDEVFGIRSGQLNDDRVGRALTAIAPKLDQIVGSVGVRAIEAFGIDVARCHWDMTSISMHGAYEDNDPQYPAVKFGHPKDRRPDLKQVQTGLMVTGDGGVPVFHRAFDGGAGEVGQVVPVMQAMQTMAGRQQLFIVGDSKLVSYQNLTTMDADGVWFLAPASKTYVSADDLRAVPDGQAVPVDYVAARDAGKSPDQRGTWRVWEDTMTIAGPRKRDAPLAVRRVFVHSSAREQAAKTARARKLDRARADLGRLQRGLGSRHYRDVAAVEARIVAIGSARRVAGWIQAVTGTDPDTGKPTLTWEFDKAAIAAEAATDGWYALLTNVPATEADAAEILRRYKGQEAVERRYAAFKGPMAVAPLYLKDNRRLAALITVICLALLVFCLIERQVRQALAVQGQIKVPGLYAGRPAVPTGQLILGALASIRLVPATDSQPPVVGQPSALQLSLLDLLGIDLLEWC